MVCNQHHPPPNHYHQGPPSPRPYLQIAVWMRSSLSAIPAGW
jgi:hypothetical protein